MGIKDMLDRIKVAGWTDAQIGKAVGAPASIITRLRNGNHRQTSYERGCAIEALAKRVAARVQKRAARQDGA